MSRTFQKTILSTDLAVIAVTLRKDGYDRFAFQFNEDNKKMIELKAWTYIPRPDKRKPQLESQEEENA